VRYHAGIPWRDLPERFGHFRAVHRRHSRWSNKVTWEAVFEALAEDRQHHRTRSSAQRSVVERCIE